MQFTIFIFFIAIIKRFNNRNIGNDVSLLFFGIMNQNECEMHQHITIMPLQYWVNLFLLFGTAWKYECFFRFHPIWHCLHQQFDTMAPSLQCTRSATGATVGNHWNYHRGWQFHQNFTGSNSAHRSGYRSTPKVAGLGATFASQRHQQVKWVCYSGKLMDKTLDGVVVSEIMKQGGRGTD